MVAVRLILLFLPYLLIPLFLVYLAKKRPLFPIGFTYLLASFLVFLYPFLLFWIDGLLNPKTVKCLNPEFAVIAANTVVMIPVSLLIQFILNAIINPKSNSF